MIDALSGRELTILALGPLTNIAAVIKTRPDLINRIRRIIFVGGQIPGDRFFAGSRPFVHLHDMNVRKDVLAVETVLNSSVPLVLIPFELAKNVSIDDAVLGRFKEQDPAIQWLVDDSQKWLMTWKIGLGETGFYPFDTLAVRYAINPNAFGCLQVDGKLVKRREYFVSQRDTLEVVPSQQPGRPAQYCQKFARDDGHSPQWKRI